MSTGNQFAALLTRNPYNFKKVYNIVRGRVGKYLMLLSGEIDCVDGNKILEIKTFRPANFNSFRKKCTWLQSYLGMVNELVTASYKELGNQCIFAQSNIEHTPLVEGNLSKYDVDSKFKSNCFTNTEQLFDKLFEKLNKAGPTIYRVERTKYNSPGNPDFSEVKFQFPINSEFVDQLTVKVNNFKQQNQLVQDAADEFKHLTIGSEIESSQPSSTLPISSKPFANVETTHAEKQFNSNRGGGYRRDVQCFRCGLLGHIRANCTTEEENCRPPPRTSSSRNGRAGKQRW